MTGSCKLFASFEILCPLCGVKVPANSHHSCSIDTNKVMLPLSTKAKRQAIASKTQTKKARLDKEGV